MGTNGIILSASKINKPEKTLHITAIFLVLKTLNKRFPTIYLTSTPPINPANRKSVIIIRGIPVIIIPIKAIRGITKITPKKPIKKCFQG